MRSITVYKSYYGPDDVYEGAINYRQEESYTLEHDSEDGLSAVEWALEEMNHEGYFEYSSYPFQPGGWWGADELDGDGNYTGNRVETSFHLNGFTEDEQRAVYDAY